MTVYDPILRKQLTREMTWDELDSNFEKITNSVADISTEIGDTNNRIDDVVDVVDITLNEVVVGLQGDLTNAVDLLNDEIDSVRNDSTVALTNARNDLELAISDLNQTTMDGFQLVSDVTSELDTRIENYRTDFNSEVDGLQNQLDDRLSEVDSIIADVRDRFSVEINRNMLDRKASDRLLFDTMALAVQLRQNQQNITNAIFEVDPLTGTIRNLAYAYTDNQFTQAGLLIDGVNAKVDLQAQRVISTENRLTNAESQILLQAGQIDLRATYTEVNSIVAGAIDAVLPAYSFGFFNSAEGWVAVNGTLTPATSKINLTLGDIENTALDYVADENPLMSISIERTGGTGWVGSIVITFDDNSTQTYAGVIEDIPTGNIFVRNLNLDGEVTYTGNVTGVRLILGATTADTFTINSITIGKPSAALTELEGITAQINQVGIELNALDASLTNYVTVDLYNEEGVTRSNVESVLNGVDSYAAIQATLQQFDNNETLTKANYAALWVDAANANIEQAVQSYNAREGGLDDQLGIITGDLTVASSKIDAANGKISDQIVSISGIKSQSKNLEQIALQAEYQLYLAKKNQLEQGVVIAIAKNELNTVSNEQLALAEEILLLEAKFGTDVGQVNATLFELNQAIANETEARVQSIQSLEADFNQSINATADVIVEVISNNEIALSQQILNLQTSFDEQINANVSQLLQAVSDEQQARITQFNVLQTEFGDEIQATKQELTTLVSSETQARIQDITEIEVEFAGNYATKFEVTDVVATETQSRFEQIQDISVGFGNDIEAARQESITLVANESQSRISQINDLSATIGTTYASKTEVTDVVATETNARIQAIDSLLVNVENNFATIGRVDEIEADAISAKASASTALISISGVQRKTDATALEQLIEGYRLYLAEKGQLEIGVAVARAETGLQTLTTANQALAQELTVLDAKIGTVNGSVSANYSELNQAIVTEIDSRVQSFETLNTSFTDNISSVQENLNVSFSNAIETINQNITSLDSKFQGIASATILTVQQTVANEAFARSEALTALESTFGGNLSSSVNTLNQTIADEQSTRASAINILRSENAAGLSATNTILNQTKATADGAAEGLLGLRSSIVGEGGDINQAELILKTAIDDAGEAVGRAFLGVTSVSGGVARISGISIGGIENALRFQGDIFSLTATNGSQRLYWDELEDTWVFNGKLVIGGYEVTSEDDIRALDGENGVTVVMSSEAHVLPANSDGVVSSFEGSGFTIQVLEGSAALIFNSVSSAYPAAGRYNIQRFQPNLTATAATGQGTTTLTQPDYTAMNADNSTCTYVIRVTNSRGEQLPPITKIQSVVKSKQGVTGSSGVYNEFRYRRGITQPALTTTNLNPSNWSLVIPSGDDPIWFTTAIKNVATGQFEGANWSTPARLTGENGTSVSIKGELSNTSQLPTPPANPSDAYIISGNLWVWSGTAWINAGAIQGAKGNDGQSSFKSIVFRRTSSNIANSPPTGGSFSSPVPTTSGWSDGIPSGTLQLWSSTRVFTSDGNAPQEAAWSNPVRMTNTAELQIQYSSMISNQGTPTTSPDNWSTDPSVDTVWMATRNITNGVAGSWQVFKVKGESGTDAATLSAIASTQGIVYRKDGTRSADSVTISTVSQYLPAGGVYEYQLQTWRNDGTYSTNTVRSDGSMTNIHWTIAANGASATLNTSSSYSVFNAQSVFTSYRIRVRYIVGSTTIDEDVVSINKLYDGSEAITVTLSNEAHTLPASATGSVSSMVNSGTNITAFQGATSLVFRGTGSDNSYPTQNSSFHIRRVFSSNMRDAGTVAGAGTITATQPDYGNVVGDGTSSDWVDFEVRVRDKDGITLPVIKKRQTLTKSLRGADGIDGLAGAVGAGFYGSTYTTISWTTSTASSRFQSLVGRPPVNFDVFTQTRTDGTDSQARQFNGTSWGAVALQVNGSIVASGTIAGDRLIAGTELNSPVIKGGEIIVAKDGIQFMSIIRAEPFGSSNDLVEWYGARINGVTWNNATNNPIYSGMTKANAKTYKTVNGSVFFGGTFVAGVLRNAQTNSQLIPNPTVEMLFSSQGGQIEIAASLSYTNVITMSGENPHLCPVPSTPPSGIIYIDRWNGSSWIQVAQANITGTWDCQAGIPAQGFDPALPATVTITAGATVTTTDAQMLSSNRRYRARTSFNGGYSFSGVTQFLSVTSAED